MPYIDTIDYATATGELRTIYDGLIESRGKLADVHMIQSLNPPTISSHMNLYLDIMFRKSPLKRYQREMIGVIVSAANGCEYCVMHHREALLHFWKNADKADALIREPESAGLPAKDLALCKYARELTLQPGSSAEGKIAAMRSVGLSDRAILDATLVVGYFNFVNRIVLGLGVPVNESEIGGYVYE